MRSGSAGVVFAIVCAALAVACSDGAPLRPVVPGGDAARGRTLVATYGCGGCHMVSGVPGAVGRVGPPLDGIAERTFIVGGLRNEPASLVRWIRSPQSVEPGTVMPDLGVTEPHARDIAAYLYTLGSGTLGPPYLVPPRVLPTH